MYYVGLLCSQLKSLVLLWYISRQLQSDIHVFEWGSFGLSGTSYYRTRASFNLCTIKQLCDRGAKNSILHFSCDVLTYTSSYLNDKNQRYTSANCWHLVCPEELFQSISVFVGDKTFRWNDISLSHKLVCVLRLPEVELKLETLVLK